uniref:Helitron helicase-like domain-containing protein n=1 Tax=Chromera velia CCMP2878 TaxID=1169474 RepID=A0A0G4HSQ6_9ALVE|eukprot:Cvel_8309.t1-p1 / transcript=Cvel_8309.t1 / gene=Cvel_8309 / organism=Chromera_velia_CCMP2878 / gene_product=hypothetical protein / transcript_product=hypothetical protein / location=Cvel_scaffold456:40569-40883(-) / protein_length=105 / sequence_SO=supercontig / SO=protein_coding / is_pseudo=false
MIEMVKDHIFGYAYDQFGLFGPVAEYYGTVEAQARGTLHCHMLIWTARCPASPEEFEKSLQSPEFVQRLMSWLSTTIEQDFFGFGETDMVVPSVTPKTNPRLFTD